MFAPTYPSGGGSFVQVLLSLPPRYSIADLSTRFWYFVSDAATVPLSLLALSFGVTNTSLRTLLISSVLGAQSDMCLTGSHRRNLCSLRNHAGNMCSMRVAPHSAGREAPDGKPVLFAGHAALHLAYVWAWPSGEARTLRELVRELLRQPEGLQSSATQRSENTAGIKQPDAAIQQSSQQSSCTAQPSPDEDEDVLRDAAPHVKAVLRWSAAPSWAEKRACSNSNLQVLGTGFDIAVHVLMLAGHLRVLSGINS